MFHNKAIKPPKKENKEENKKKKRIKAIIICLVLFCVIAFMIIHIGVVTERGNLSLYDGVPQGLLHIVHAPLDIFPFPKGVGPFLLLEALAIATITFFVSVNLKLRKHDDPETIAGDAKWLTGEALRAYNYEFTDPPNSYDTSSYNNIIMSNDIKLSMDAKRTNRNLNVLVIGGSGTGKSFRIVGPNILQRNCSMVITDPSGGLFKQYSTYLECFGYKIKCFNLDHMDKSNRYNPFNYIASDKDIEILVTMLITNTNSPEARGGDQFWEKCEIALLCALIAYLFHYRPVSERNFSQVKDMIRSADVDENNSSSQSKLDIVFEELRAKHPDCFAITQYDTFRLGAGKTLKSILISCAVRLQAFDLEDVRNLTDEDDIDLDSVADEKTAIFIIVPTGEKTFNFLAGLMYSQLFTRLYRYCENTAEFGYVVEDDSGDVVRVFTANNSSEMPAAKERAEKFLNMFQKAKPVARADWDIEQDDNKMEFYEIRSEDEEGNSQMLSFRGSKDLAEKMIKKMKNGKVVPNNKRGNGGQRCPIHVRFLLDEFANTGKIPDFTEKISTIRKYEISTTIILQSLKQIRNLYEKEWDVISANCDTTVYLGGGIDMETTEWLSKVFGKKTVRSMNESLSKSGGSESFQRQGIELYAVNQLRTMPNEDCIVIPRSQDPCLGRMYDTPHHPEWETLCSLPSYSFDRKRYLYIQEQLTLKDEVKKEEAKTKADKIEDETPRDTTYRNEQNEKEEQLSAEVNGDKDIEMGKKIGKIKEEKPAKPAREKPREAVNMDFDVSDVLELSEQDDGIYTPEDLTPEPEVPEVPPSDQDIAQEDVDEMLEFSFDDDMSFSVAPQDP